MTDSESEHFTVAVRDMRHVKVGDHVLRKFPGSQDFDSGPTVTLVVTEVDGELIYCGPKGVGWSFDRATGLEVDDDLRWGPTYGVTGTFLVGFAEAAVPESVPALVRHLQDCIGQDLTAYVAGVIDAKLVRRWIASAQHLAEMPVLRLRCTFEIARLFTEAYDIDTAKAWLFGMNSRLDEEAPAYRIRHAQSREDIEEVELTARAFCGAQYDRR